MIGAAAAPTRNIARLAGWAAVAGATVGLFVISHGKWSDAIIDSGREWIVPDTLARGGLLYRDAVYWFGPFTPYFHGAFFRLFGSNFQTLALAGALGAAGALVCLLIALRQVTARTEAAIWTALSIPALVFMPDAGGAILGMGYRMWHAAAFSLLAITAASGPAPAPRRLVGAGALAGMAGLCRTEWGLAALSAVVLLLALGRTRVGALGLVVASFTVVFCGVWLFFIARVGWRSLALDQPVFLFGIPEATRAHAGLTLLWAGKKGAWNLLYSVLVWLGLAILVKVIVFRKDAPGEAGRRLSILAVVLAGAGLCAAAGGIPGPVVFTAAPAVCVAAIIEGWRGRRDPRLRCLAAFGWMGLAASHRRLFFVEDGPYVAPPLLFAFVCAAGLLWQTCEREPAASRRRLATAFSTVVAALVIAAFAARMISYRSDDRVPIPGTGGMLSERPDVARQIADLAAAVARATRSDEGLVVFPEGEVLNFLSERSNPIRHKLYIPGYLTRENEAQVVAELERNPPASVVLWPRLTGEYGPGVSASDPSGLLGGWLAANYRFAPFPLAAAQRSRVLLGTRNRANASAIR